MRILVVEDDARLGSLLHRGLGEEGYAVDVAATGEDALWRVAEYAYSAVVLDVGLPDLDGFTVCRRIRSAGAWVPVLMLTALDSVANRVRGLDVGADDYLVKPFAFDELVARLRALIRRGAGPRPSLLVVGDLELDPGAHTVVRRGRPIRLTAKEFALLECLMRNQGQVLTRTQLLEHVWDSAYDGDPHVVTVFVAYLRDKIDRPFGTACLETVRGVGYRLRDHELTSASD
jgi:two-component system OmpR family response regulator